MVTINQKPERMEQLRATFVKPLTQTPQTQAASGCTTVFIDGNDNLPDRSKILLHVQVSMRHH
jgi:hypothetical protein